MLKRRECSRRFSGSGNTAGVEVLVAVNGLALRQMRLLDPGTTSGARPAREADKQVGQVTAEQVIEPGRGPGKVGVDDRLLTGVHRLCCRSGNRQ
ncbi:hypothetical protein FB565_003001 [Actinoplanes lutulentus]|uniref:hypothetical protein n=1 Tax=Actinoplanes lutulentus TaxID=1287878 RepID=UPI000DB921BC|nr:hypothetical protein [Actinoplanes lutulentus]MBB2943288.1 hypothetical protein [Actinoplanes lutulentus]